MCVWVYGAPDQPLSQSLPSNLFEAGSPCFSSLYWPWALRDPLISAPISLKEHWDFKSMPCLALGLGNLNSGPRASMAVFYPCTHLPSSYSVVLKVEGTTFCTHYDNSYQENRKYQVLVEMWRGWNHRTVGGDVRRRNCDRKKYGDPKTNFKRVVMRSGSLISGLIPQTIENNDSSRHLCIRIHSGIVQEAKR